MGRIIQPKGTKGSLKWIQHVIKEFPDVLNDPILDAIGTEKKQSVEWLSPLAGDGYSGI